jgi:hypothetical protein
LEQSDFVDPRSEKSLTEEGRYPEVGSFIWPQRLRDTSDQYCGYDVFVGDGGLRNVLVQEIGPGPNPRSKNWPFDQSVVLAKESGIKLFDPVIACSALYAEDGYPRCGVTSTYRGWPMKLIFSAAAVCSASDLIVHARKFLDRYRVGETARSPGQIEHRTFH